MIFFNPKVLVNTLDFGLILEPEVTRRYKTRDDQIDILAIDGVCIIEANG